MAFSFKSSDTSVEDGVVRIAVDQIDTALDEIRNPALSAAERVHQIRKRCKKVRGVARLVRPGLDDYAEINRRFRDIARSVSDMRDNGALLEIFDGLIDSAETGIPQEAQAPVRDWLVAQCEGALQKDAESRLVHTERQLQEARAAVATWSLDEPGLKSAMAGMAKTYRRARRKFSELGRDGDTEAFHEWRKHVKYHWYHARLCKRIAPDIMGIRISQLDQFAKWLGEHHDLYALQMCLAEAPEVIASAPAFGRIQEAIERRRRALEIAALSAGEQLFADKPKTIARRWRNDWIDWRAEPVLDRAGDQTDTAT